MKRIYLAGPLFSVAEQELNRRLARRLEAGLHRVDVILPQVRAKPLLLRRDGKKRVFRDCLDMVNLSDLVLAILDGSDADSGTCVEIGYAFSVGKPILGIRSDFRPSEDRGVNLMVSHACTHLIQATFDSIDHLSKVVVEKAGEILGIAGPAKTRPR